MFFWNSLAFSMIQPVLAVRSLVPLPFLNPTWAFGSSYFRYCWSLAWRILCISLLPCERSAIVQCFEHSLALPFFGIGMRPFPVPWPLLSFPNLLAYWVQHFHRIIFQDLKQLNWNSIISTGFVHSDSKAHLTSVSGCLALGEWSHHRDYLSCEDLFCTVLLCILANSS